MTKLWTHTQVVSAGSYVPFAEEFSTHSTMYNTGTAVVGQFVWIKDSSTRYGLNDLSPVAHVYHFKYPINCNGAWNCQSLALG